MSTIDYRYVSVLKDDILQETITAYELLYPYQSNPHIRAELAAIRIFACFAWGIKRWDDGLIESSRARIREGANGSNGAGSNGNGVYGYGAGVDEAHAILQSLVEKIAADEYHDVLLSKILEECLKVGAQEGVADGDEGTAPIRF